MNSQEQQLCHLYKERPREKNYMLFASRESGRKGERRGGEIEKERENEAAEDTVQQSELETAEDQEASTATRDEGDDNDDDDPSKRRRRRGKRGGRRRGRRGRGEDGITDENSVEATSEEDAAEDTDEASAPGEATAPGSEVNSESDQDNLLSLFLHSDLKSPSAHQVLEQAHCKQNGEPLAPLD